MGSAEGDAMRVALILDMEGVSHIGDLHEAYPQFPEYWRAGRDKLAADVVAASRGLLAGGASEVIVFNRHGGWTWPNLIVDRLPERARLADGLSDLVIRDHADAMFQVGVHAGGGGRGFLSHTICPGLRLRVGEEMVTESHWWAWTGDVPLLGIVGSEALRDELGTLRDTPFLGVQVSSDRAVSRPAFDSASETADAILAFAADAARRVVDRRISTPVGPVTLEASFPNGAEAAGAMAEGGWRQTSATTFEVEASGWRSDGEPIDQAIETAAGAAYSPYALMFKGLDLTSEETALSYPADARARSAEMLRAWAADQPPRWYDASMAGRHEGAGASSAIGGPMPSA
jgi:D-aminopeptidase